MPRRYDPSGRRSSRYSTAKKSVIPLALFTLEPRREEPRERKGICFSPLFSAPFVSLGNFCVKSISSSCTQVAPTAPASRANHRRHCPSPHRNRRRHPRPDPLGRRTPPQPQTPLHRLLRRRPSRPPQSLPSDKRPGLRRRRKKRSTSSVPLQNPQGYPKHELTGGGTVPFNESTMENLGVNDENPTL